MSLFVLARLCFVLPASEGYRSAVAAEELLEMTAEE